MKLITNLLASAGLLAAASQPFVFAPPSFSGPTRARRRKGEGAGQYGKALTGYISRKQAQRQAERKVHPLRDESGVFTLVGARLPDGPNPPRKGRRIWLAGISAQRGY